MGSSVKVQVAESTGRQEVDVSAITNRRQTTKIKPPIAPTRTGRPTASSARLGDPDEPRASTRRKAVRESPPTPPAKSHHAQSLFGAPLNLSSQPFRPAPKPRTSTLHNDGPTTQVPQTSTEPEAHVPLEQQSFPRPCLSSVTTSKPAPPTTETGAHVLLQKQSSTRPRLSSPTTSKPAPQVAESYKQSKSVSKPAPKPSVSDPAPKPSARVQKKDYEASTSQTSQTTEAPATKLRSGPRTLLRSRGPRPKPGLLIASEKRIPLKKPERPASHSKSVSPSPRKSTSPSASSSSSSSSSSSLSLPPTRPSRKRRTVAEPPRIAKMARKSVKSKEVFGLVLPDETIQPAPQPVPQPPERSTSSGAWSRHSSDLLGMTRPANRTSRRR